MSSGREESTPFDWSALPSADHPADHVPVRPPLVRDSEFGGRSSAVRFPRRCSCCGRTPADEQKGISRSYAPLFGDFIETRSISVPICSSCSRTTEFRRKLVNRLFLILAVVAPIFAFVSIRARIPEALPEWPASVYFGPFFSLLLMLFGWVLTRRAANVDFARYRLNRTLLFTNAAYQREFESLNEGSPICPKRGSVVRDVVGHTALACLLGVLGMFVGFAGGPWISPWGWLMMGDLAPFAVGWNGGLSFGWLPAVVATVAMWGGRRPMRWGRLLACAVIGNLAGGVGCGLANVAMPVGFLDANIIPVALGTVALPAAVAALLSAWLLR